MWDLLSRYRGILVVLGLLLVPVVLLYAQTRDAASRGPVVGVVVDGSALVERGMRAATGTIADALSQYLLSVGSWDELARLRRRDAAHVALEVRVRELEDTNENLAKLARIAERVDGPRPLGARVVGRSGAPLTRILRVDRGARDGVRRGDGVLGDGGIVGRVLAVGHTACDVLLVSDPTSALDVVVQRTRTRGLLRGTGDPTRHRAQVLDLDHVSEVTAGDFVVTSGHDPQFPPGLAVGEIEHVLEPNDALFKEALVRPAVDLARVERVLILIERRGPRLPQLADGILPSVRDDGVPRLLALPDREPRAETP